MLARGAATAISNSLSAIQATMINERKCSDGGRRSKTWNASGCESGTIRI